MEINWFTAVVVVGMCGLIAYRMWRFRTKVVVPGTEIATMMATAAARHNGSTITSQHRNKPLSISGSTGSTAWELNYFTSTELEDTSVSGFHQDYPYFLWQAAVPTAPGAEVVVIQSVPVQIANFHRAVNTPLIGSISLQNALRFVASMTDNKMKFDLPLLPGTAAWRERFAVFARDEATAARLVNTEVQALLSAHIARYPDNSAPILIAWTTTGLRQVIQPRRRDLVNEAFLEEFIQLGSRLAQAVQS